MAGKMVSMDEVPFSRFHLRLLLISSGLNFTAGYGVGNIAIALPVMAGQIPVSSQMSGLIGMGVFLGSIFGSVVGGKLSDAWGRRKMFYAVFGWVLATSVISWFTPSADFLFCQRVLVGAGLGATFSVSGPYMAEFAPQKSRGNVVGALNALWFIGYAASNVVCYLLIGAGPDAWRWMLASTAAPCIIWMLAGLRMPESPRWLIERGRTGDAARVLALVGPNVTMTGIEDGGASCPKFRTRDLFHGTYARRVLFVAIFWSLQVIPTFSLGTYLPSIVAECGFGTGDAQYLGTAVINCLYLIGLVPMLLLVDKMGRRPLLIGTSAVCAAALAVIGLTMGLGLHNATVIGLFVLFGATNTAGGSLQYVYPNELFPTTIRGTAVGFCTSLTRVVSAAATFMTPCIIEAAGSQTTILACAALSLAGAIYASHSAPETRGLDLADAATAGQARNDLGSRTQTSKARAGSFGPIAPKANEP